MSRHSMVKETPGARIVALKAEVNSRIQDAADAKDEAELMTSWHLHELLDACVYADPETRRVMVLTRAAKIIYPVVREALGLKWNDAMANRLSIDQNCVLAMKALENAGIR